jgi:hypothetical protein
MRTPTNTTRRSLLKGGALLAVPLAAAVPTAVITDGEVKARLAKLEDQAAIRDLHQTWLRRILTGAGDPATAPGASPEGLAFHRTVRGIAADHSGQPDAIEIAADRQSAVGRFPCTFEIETTIAKDCTLAQMAHAQGGGFVRGSERRMLLVEYVKASGAWVIAKIEFASRSASASPDAPVRA